MADNTQNEKADGDVPPNPQDVASNNFEVNSQEQLVEPKNTKKEISKEGNTVLFRWLKDKYKQIYGRGSGATVAQDRQNACDEFDVDEVNAVHDGANNIKGCQKRRDNMTN